jgi:hypothetical protein
MTYSVCGINENNVMVVDIYATERAAKRAAKKSVLQSIKIIARDEYGRGGEVSR